MNEPQSQEERHAAEIARIEALTPEATQAEVEKINARMNARRERFREESERMMREENLLP